MVPPEPPRYSPRTMARLVVKTGKYKGRSFELKRAAILGRGETADVRFPDNSASREHCRVFQQGGAWVVADLNSRNGIKVNGLSVTRRTLRLGDIIDVGETEFEYDGATAGGSGGAPARAPAAAAPKKPAKPSKADAKAEEARKRKQEAFAAARADAKGGSGGGGGTGQGIEVSDRVLQFNKVDSSSPLAIDLDQYSGTTKLIIAVVTLAFVLGVGWAVVHFLGN